MPRTSFEHFCLVTLSALVCRASVWAEMLPPAFVNTCYSLPENGSRILSPKLMMFLFGKLILCVFLDHITMVIHFILLPRKAQYCVKTLMTIIIVILLTEKKNLILSTLEKKHFNYPG